MHCCVIQNKRKIGVSGDEVIVRRICTVYVLFVTRASLEPPLKEQKQSIQCDPSPANKLRFTQAREQLAAELTGMLADGELTETSAELVVMAAVITRESYKDFLSARIYSKVDLNDKKMYDANRQMILKMWTVVLAGGLFFICNSCPHACMRF